MHHVQCCIHTTQCVTPYVGDGSLCVLDSDGDGYPDQALRNCSTDDQSTYCSTDTCPFAPNHNQDDRTPCIGDKTGKWPTHSQYLHFDFSTDCPAEVDEVWSIRWPFAPISSTVTVSCGVNFIGIAM